MRNVFYFLLLTLSLTACNEEKVFHSYEDFDNSQWLVSKSPQFTFVIEDTTQQYLMYCGVRNSTKYPYSRLFIDYTLSDTLGNVIEARLLQGFLFDPKTGEPLGNSDIGDLYDHEIPILNNHKFKKAGAYRVVLKQKMRADTLVGITAVGLGVERVMPD